MSDSLSQNILAFIQGRISEDELKAKIQQRKNNKTLESHIYTEQEQHWKKSRS